MDIRIEINDDSSENIISLMKGILSNNRSLPLNFPSETISSNKTSNISQEDLKAYHEEDSTNVLFEIINKSVKDRFNDLQYRAVESLFKGIKKVPDPNIEVLPEGTVCIWVGMSPRIGKTSVYLLNKSYRLNKCEGKYHYEYLLVAPEWLQKLFPVDSEPIFL